MLSRIFASGKSSFWIWTLRLAAAAASAAASAPSATSAALRGTVACVVAAPAEWRGVATRRGAAAWRAGWGGLLAGRRATANSRLAATATIYHRRLA